MVFKGQNSELKLGAFTKKNLIIYMALFLDMA